MIRARPCAVAPGLGLEGRRPTQAFVGLARPRANPRETIPLEGAGHGREYAFRRSRCARPRGGLCHVTERDLKPTEPTGVALVSAKMEAPCAYRARSSPFAN